jgi:hypothetical protein
MQTTNERAAPAGTGNGSEYDQLGSIINADDSVRRRERQAPQPVHLGDRCIGFLISLPTGYEAVTRFGVHLGLYNTVCGAASALAAKTTPPGSDGVSCTG